MTYYIINTHKKLVLRPGTTDLEKAKAWTGGMNLFDYRKPFHVADASAARYLENYSHYERADCVGLFGTKADAEEPATEAELAFF